MAGVPGGEPQDLVDLITTDRHQDLIEQRPSRILETAQGEQQTGCPRPADPQPAELADHLINRDVQRTYCGWSDQQCHWCRGMLQERGNEQVVTTRAGGP